MKVVLWIVALLVGVAIAYPAWLGFRIYQQSHRDELSAADAIVVLGAAQYDGEPSPVFKARLDQGAFLYEEGFSDLVMVSGGKQKSDRFTEAEVGEQYLFEEYSIPYDQVTGETEGTTTLESMRNIRSVAEERGVDSVLLVSDPLHSSRVKRIALDLGFKRALASPASYVALNRSRETKVQELLHEVAAMLAYEIFNR
jgi:uncharacterized SAM-binding protein YcdF (DUF218 family)